ncbi:hypothetical protein L3571_006243 [Pseudomonas aeruginosa]|nr:hypothetical protein [Pseudomonas aeruginosa]EKX7928320.1 hypothetical protein [Pseudomonas aeruginosa]
MTESKICTCPSGDGSLVHPCPAHPSVEQAGGDERAEFERAFTVQEGIYFDDKRGEYRSMNLCAIEASDAQDLNLQLQGWQARAALAQPSPAPKLERPEVYDSGLISMLHTDKNVRQFVSLEQYERIVGALRALAEREYYQGNLYLDRARMAECELEAAQARVAELELKLDKSDYAYDNDRIHMRGLAARAIARAKVFDDGSDGADAESARSVVAILRELLAVGPAQAQHSVPGDIMRDAQRYRWLRDQQFYFSFSTENSDAGISSCTAGMSSRFKNLSWVDAAIDSAIAAAPGKEVGHE